VVIITALTFIFTIGLSDEGNKDGISAYSVFNRGFEKLLGSVDVDSLLAQHVGGGFGGGGLGMGDPDNNNNDVDREDRRPVQERAARRPNQQDEDNNENENDEDNNQNANNNNRSRKSGKKARRRNLDQRRDIQRQREAAIQMGLDGGEGPEEMMAMQRLIEDQLAAENN
jgi:hypothetical protein